jgi:hypothetical protein
MGAFAATGTFYAIQSKAVVAYFTGADAVKRYGAAGVHYADIVNKRI